MGILGRVKNRVKRAIGRPPPQRAPWRFQGSIPDTWKDLGEHYTLGYQTMASATVASWEVVLAELGRALRTTHPDRAVEWTGRFSDALVPTVGAFEAAGRASSATWKEGSRAAASSGDLSAAIPPIRDQARAVGAAVESGWPKTLDYLEPVLGGVGLSAEERARLGSVGPALRAGLDNRAAAFATALDEVVRAEDVSAAFLDAIEGWRHGSAQDLEVALDQVRSVLVTAAAR